MHKVDSKLAKNNKGNAAQDTFESARKGGNPFWINRYFFYGVQLIPRACRS